jgi:hypothetical protein
MSMELPSLEGNPSEGIVGRFLLGVRDRVSLGIANLISGQPHVR